MPFACRVLGSCRTRLSVGVVRVMAWMVPRIQPAA